MTYRLLTPGDSNPKTAKLAADLGVLSAILHLAPADDGAPDGKTVCPMAEAAGCKAACLAFQGRARLFESIREARRRKTAYYFEDRAAFMADLRADLRKLERRAAKLGLRPVVRLDGTSDLGFAEGLHRDFPGIVFYDYTKLPARVRRWLRMRANGEARNWHLTFSLGAHNHAEAAGLLAEGVGVAVPFDVRRGAPLPEIYLGARVIDGDTHDYRFTDPRGVVVGLRAKGNSAVIGEGSGFIVKVGVGEAAQAAA
jgi:hypothetical protein